MKKLSDGSVSVVSITMISLALMVNDIYLPGVVEMAEEFKISENLAGMTIVLYFVFYSFGQVVIGPLSDIYGRWKPLVWFQALFFLASAGCAVSGSFTSLILFRILQAVGGCSGPVIGRAMMCDVCTTEKFTRMMSITAIVKAVVPGLAPILGAFLLGVAGWRCGFFCVAVVAGAVFMIIYLKMPETLTAKSSKKPTLKTVLESYAGLLKDRTFLRYTLCAAFIGGGFFVIMVVAPFACMREYGLPAKMFSLIYGLHVVFFILGATLLNILKRSGGRMPYVKVLIVFSLILCVISIYLGIRPGIFLLSADTMIFTMMMGALVPSLTADAIVNFSRRAGAASALNGFLFYFIGSAVSIGVTSIPEAWIKRSNLLALSTVGLCLLTLAAYLVLTPKSGGRSAKDIKIRSLAKEHSNFTTAKPGNF